MKNYGIIFDCDGTLVDSLSQSLVSFNFALAQVGESPRTSLEIKRYFGQAADRILQQLLVDEDKAAKAFNFFQEHQSESAKTTHLHPGIRELLDLLEEEEIPLGIVTGRHSQDLESLLKPHSLSDYFITLVADNHLPKSKPAPDGILLAAQKMGLHPANTFYVGDSIVDIQAAKAAGSVSVAALWDHLVKPEKMRRENPDFTANSPHEVRGFFKQRFKI